MGSPDEPTLFEITDKKIKQQFDLTSARVGTHMYRAPEMVSRKKTFSYAIDGWGLGCTLYFLLVGKPPFDPNLE